MDSITEEKENVYNNIENDSLPLSDVYFMKKEEKQFIENSKNLTSKLPIDINIDGFNNTNIIKQINNNSNKNNTFLSTNIVDNNLNINKETNNEIINNKELIKEKDELINEQQKIIINDENYSNNSNNKLNFIKDDNDIESIKKWQNTMKTKWLQNILNESSTADIINNVPKEKENNNNNVTINGCIQINTDNNNKEEKKVEENHLLPKLIITPKTLSETFEKLQCTTTTTTKTLLNSTEKQILTTNQENNNRNLIYTNENLNINNNILTGNLKQDNKIYNNNSKEKDCLKFDIDDKIIINDSKRNSRHSSITDSLHEFETSLYDMLQQSAKENGSDDDDRDDDDVENNNITVIDKNLNTTKSLTS